MNELAGNPNFTRPDGSHVVIDAPDYTANASNDEDYGESPDNKYTFYLVDPSGNVTATAASPQTVNGTPAGTASLPVASPASGTWQIQVVLNLTVSGKEFTQTVYGDVQDP